MQGPCDTPGVQLISPSLGKSPAADESRGIEGLCVHTHTRHSPHRDTRGTVVVACAPHHGATATGVPHVPDCHRGCDVVDPANVNGTRVHGTGMVAARMDAANMNAACMHGTGMDAARMDAADMNATRAHGTGMDAARMDAAHMHGTGMEATRMPPLRQLAGLGLEPLLQLVLLVRCRCRLLLVDCGGLLHILELVPASGVARPAATASRMPDARATPVGCVAAMVHPAGGHGCMAGRDGGPARAGPASAGPAGSPAGHDDTTAGRSAADRHGAAAGPCVNGAAGDHCAVASSGNRHPAGPGGGVAGVAAMARITQATARGVAGMGGLRVPPPRHLRGLIQELLFQLRLRVRRPPGGHGRSGGALADIGLTPTCHHREHFLHGALFTAPRVLRSAAMGLLQRHCGTTQGWRCCRISGGCSGDGGTEHGGTKHTLHPGDHVPQRACGDSGDGS